jgi:Zn-dependent protease with chaperone function
VTAEKRAARLYSLQLGVAGVGLVLVVGAGAFVVGDARLAPVSAEAIAAACDRWISSGGLTTLAAISVIALVALTLAIAGRSIRRQVRATRRYVRGLGPASGPKEVAGARVHVVDTPEPSAFCAGYLRPRIYLSRVALSELDDRELAAVIAHERHHVRRRDPLRLLLSRALADALFFIPVLRPISERYESLGELAADEAAVRDAAGRSSLASALIKLGEAGPHSPGIVAIAPERVDHLMGDREASRWRLHARPVGRSVLALAFLTGLVLFAAEVELALQLPALLASACMVATIGAAIALAFWALVVSRRYLSSRRA